MPRPGGRGCQNTTATPPGSGSCSPRRAPRIRPASPTTRRWRRRSATAGSTARHVAKTKPPTVSASRRAGSAAPGRSETPASPSGYTPKAECIRPARRRSSGQRPTAAGTPPTPARRASRSRPTSPRGSPRSRRRRRCSRSSTARTATPSSTGSQPQSDQILARAGSSSSSRCSPAARRFTRRSAVSWSEIGDDQDVRSKKGRTRMYRHRIRQQILYGQFREYMESAEEVIALRAKLGLAASTLWAPTFGTANEVVWEIDYPDLATFQRDNASFYANAEAMEQWRLLWQFAVQGSIQDELLVEAPHIA